MTLRAKEKKVKTTEFFYNNTNCPETNAPDSIGAVILVFYQGKILLEKRSDSDRWAFIGGKVEKTESVEQAGIRELMEETGIKIQKLDFHGIFSNPTRIIKYSNGVVKRIITVVFKIELTEKPQIFCSEESKELRFFNFEEISNIFLAETHEPILETIRSSKVIIQ